MAVDVAIVLHVQLNNHAFPLVSASPDIVYQFRIGIEIVDVREVCLIQVQIDLYVVYLLRLSLEVGYGGQYFPDLSQYFFHFFGVDLVLIIVNGVEAIVQLLRLVFDLKYFLFVIFFELAEGLVFLGLGLVDLPLQRVY